jgi:hypothetical protein
VWDVFLEKIVDVLFRFIRFTHDGEDYSLSLVNPLGGNASKNLKAKLLRNFGFFCFTSLIKASFWREWKQKKPA